MAGTDIAAYLSSLGPEGMIADIPGNPRRLAQGLAAMPGPGAESLGTALTARAQGAGDRIKAEADALIGAPDAALAERRALATERASKLGPEYDAALSVTDPIPSDGMGALLDDIGKDAVGGVAASIAKISKELGRSVSKAADGREIVSFAPISAVKLHNIRSELSDDITEATRAGRGKFVSQMAPILEKIDEELDKLPG